MWVVLFVLAAKLAKLAKNQLLQMLLLVTMLPAASSPTVDCNL